MSLLNKVAAFKNAQLEDIDTQSHDILSATKIIPPQNATRAMSKLWYKNYMVWIFVIGLPTIMVMLCMWMLNFSIVNEDPVVRDDWYMDAKTLYADVTKDKLAHDIGLSGTMQITPTGNVTFSLTDSRQQPFELPDKLKVEISHATQKDKDRDFLITHQQGNIYIGHVSLASGNGKYYIIIHDIPNTWRLRDTTQLPTLTSLKFIPLTAFDMKHK